MSNGPIINYGRCNGCKTCYNECPADVFGWDSKKRRPVVLYPNECNNCGSCELDCTQVAIDVVLPAWFQLTYAKKVK
jgi:adenylylsulfate reductase subunit B